MGVKRQRTADPLPNQRQCCAAALLIKPFQRFIQQILQNRLPCTAFRKQRRAIATLRCIPPDGSCGGASSPACQNQLLHHLGQIIIIRLLHHQLIFPCRQLRHQSVLLKHIGKFSVLQSSILPLSGLSSPQKRFNRVVFRCRREQRYRTSPLSGSVSSDAPAHARRHTARSNHNCIPSPPFLLFGRGRSPPQQQPFQRHRQQGMTPASMQNKSAVSRYTPFDS